MNPSDMNFSWLFKTRFLILLLTGAVVAFASTYLFTSPLFITPKYESEAIINVPLTLVSQQYHQQGIGFGGNAETDWHIQVLRSSRMLDSLAYRFKNFSGQDNASQGFSQSRVHTELSSHISIERNRYGSVSVKVKSSCAEKAAEMANSIVQLGDIIKEDILLENRMAAYVFTKELYQQKEAELEEWLANTPLKLQNQLTASSLPFSEPSPQTTLMNAELWHLSQLKNDYERIRKSLKSPLPTTYIVSHAIVQEKPGWPPRTLFAIGASIVFIIALVFIETIRQHANYSHKSK